MVVAVAVGPLRLPEQTLVSEEPLVSGGGGEVVGPKNDLRIGTQGDYSTTSDDSDNNMIVLLFINKI